MVRSNKNITSVAQIRVFSPRVVAGGGGGGGVLVGVGGGRG